MLALTRKQGQGVVIGDDIEITIVEIQGDQVRLSIKAPKSLKILRKELLLEVEEANKASIAKILDLKAISEMLEENE